MSSTSQGDRQPTPAGATRRKLTPRKRVAFLFVTLSVPGLFAWTVMSFAARRWARPWPAADAAAIGEAALRESGRIEVHEILVPSLKGMVRPSVHDDLVYELKPSRTWTFLGTQVRTNAQGFRNGEFAKAKTPGVLRVVGIGDSIMWGWGIEEQDTCFRRLEGSLRAALERPVEVLNLAVPTYNSLQEAAVLARYGMPLEPDLVIVGYTMNDGAPPAFGGFSSPIRLAERAELFRRAEELLPGPDDVRFRGSESVLRIAAAFTWIRALAERVGVPVLLFIYPYDDADPARRLAIERGFHYVDMYPTFEALRSSHGVPNLHALAKVMAVTPWDLHPGSAAHGILSEVLLSNLIKVLKERRSVSESRGAAPLAEPPLLDLPRLVSL